MWIPIEIEEKAYLFKCLVEDNSIKYYLSNLEQIWRESSSLDSVLARSKEMNKRIEYDQETVLNTVKSCPESVDLEPCGEESNDVNILLKVKYSVSNLPFNFKWKLTLCPQSEFLHLITNPLLLTLSCLAKQNKDLKEIICKKDVEINQYKEEGAVLKRSKVATQLFNPDAFRSHYPKIKTDEFIKYADDNFEHLKTDCLELIEESSVSQNGSTKVQEVSSNQPTRSPRGAKHAKYERNLRRQRAITQMEKLTYEDSDSCTPPKVDDEIADIKRSLEELKRKQQANGSKPTSQVVNKKPKRKLNL